MPFKADTTDSRFQLYETQLRLHGHLTLTKENADSFLAARAQIIVKPHPVRSGLVVVEVQKAALSRS